MTSTTVTNTSSALPISFENSPMVTGISLQRMVSDVSINNTDMNMLSPTLSTPTMLMLNSIANIATSHSTAKKISNMSNSPAVPQLTQKNLELLLNGNQQMPFIFNLGMNSSINSFAHSTSNPNLNNLLLYPALNHSSSLGSLTNIIPTTSPSFHFPSPAKIKASPMNHMLRMPHTNLSRGVSEISCNSIGNAIFVPLANTNTFKWTPSKINNNMNMVNTVSNLSRNPIPLTPENMILKRNQLQMMKDGNRMSNKTSPIAVNGNINQLSENMRFMNISTNNVVNVSNNNNIHVNNIDINLTSNENENRMNLNAMSNEFIPNNMNGLMMDGRMYHENAAPVINIIGEMNQFNQYSIGQPNALFQMNNGLTPSMPIPQNIPYINNMNAYGRSTHGQNRQQSHRFLPPRMQWIKTSAIQPSQSPQKPIYNNDQIYSNDIPRRYPHTQQTQLQTFTKHDILQMDARQIVRCNFPLIQLINAQAIEKLARDQNGSRFIQQQIELATDDEKAGIFAQIKPHTLSLCEDVFGNYVIQKYFEFGTDLMRKELINIIHGHILSLSKSMYGCRVIQKAVEFVNRDLQMLIAKELYDYVEICVMNQNGNHVIQKMIQELDSETTRFIITAFAGKVDQLSCHPYGCRVIQRLLENGNSNQKQPILDELIENILKLSKDQYGNYVVQHVLDCGDDNARYRIIKEVAYNVLEMSKHKYSSNVVERSIINGNDMERDIMLDAIIGIKGESENVNMEDITNSPLPHMVRDQYGNYVIQTYIGKCNHKQRHRLVNMIDKLVPNLRKLMFGKHIMNKIDAYYDQPLHFARNNDRYYRNHKKYEEYDNVQY